MRLKMQTCYSLTGPSNGYCTQVSAKACDFLYKIQKHESTKICETPEPVCVKYQVGNMSYSSDIAKLHVMIFVDKNVSAAVVHITFIYLINA